MARPEYLALTLLASAALAEAPAPGEPRAGVAASAPSAAVLLPDAAAPAPSAPVSPAAPAAAEPPRADGGTPRLAAAAPLPEASEAEEPGAGADAGILYTGELTDQELARRFLEEPAALGSVSFGLTEAGRLLNGVPFPRGEAWTVVDESRAYGTQELVDAVTGAATAVREAFPGATLRVCHASSKDGGWLRPHQSHQSGRDVDLGFYYRAGVNPAAPTRPREQELDPAQNWALLKALVTSADVQFILVDQRIQRVLYAHALKAGEPKAWLDRLFLGPDTLVRHAWRHRDHFHVRFHAPRSLELGRRLQPLLSSRPEENVAMVRVRAGDTLGALALRHRSTVPLIMKANGLTGTQLVVGRTLKVPVRGPCTSCPVAPALVVPPRLLPPPTDPS